MSEDKIEFAKDLVSSNIRKTNEKINNSFDSNEDISEIKESNHTIRQIEKNEWQKQLVAYNKHPCRRFCLQNRMYSYAQPNAMPNSIRIRNSLLKINF